MKTLSIIPAACAASSTALVSALVVALALLGFATNPRAQAPEDNPIFLPTPDLPVAPAPGAYAQDGIEPEVTITETEAEVITEYRIKGRLYMVKIDPLAGQPYYLFDTNGDGQLDGQENRSGPNLTVPQWLMFSW